MDQNIRVEMDAARVCDAIAKIGYSPAAALMDIIDNSVTAGARRVVVEMDTDPDKTFAVKNNVVAYRVIDDGKGMDADEILNALKLGARADYADDSLSKFGMGLKSAGFSLGTKIQIVSKKTGVLSPISYVDKEVITREGAYVVTRPEMDADAVSEHAAKIADVASGTIIEITGCQNVRQDSASKTLRRLVEQLGVVYYAFLTEEREPLSITLRCTGKPDVAIAPQDILFTDSAKTGFDKETYDMKSPYRVLGDENREVSLQEYGVAEPMVLDAFIFPRDKMKDSAHISTEGSAFNNKNRNLIEVTEPDSDEQSRRISARRTRLLIAQSQRREATESVSN